MADTGAVLQNLRLLENAARTLNTKLNNPQDIAGVVLKEDELLAFNRALSKATRRAYQDDEGDVIASVYSRRKIEIILGLLAAKKLFQNDFMGTEPAGGFGVEFGTEAGFFGKGRDWDSDYSITGGAPANWIHSGSTQLGGTAGNPILIGNNVYHVVLGYAVYSNDALTTRTLKLIETINAGQLPVIVAEEEFRTEKYQQVLRVREVDMARYLKPQTTYKVQAQTRVTNSASEWAKPIVVTFALQNILLQTDLGNQTATVLNNLQILNTT